MTEVQLVLRSYFHDTHLRTKGTLTDTHGKAPLADHGDGYYRIVVEGCDEPKVGGSTCTQGWMHPVHVRYDTRPPSLGGYVPDGAADFPVDLTSVPTASDVDSSRSAFFQRAAAITLHNACLPLLPYTAYRHEEDYTSIILAKLDYANYFEEDTCPGRPIHNRQEAFDSLTKQSVDSKAGTSIESCPACRTGEYDVALSGYIQAIDRFGSILPADVSSRVVNVLLNKRGPIDLDDLGYSIGPVGFPETENHINLIESARYLTNDVLFGLTHDPQYDNSSNTGGVGVDELGQPIFMTMREYWLDRLHKFLQTDFIEYNAKPYQGYTMRAIQNLYTYARDDDPVKAAARMVLDYVSAKVAGSSSDNRRLVPFRRKAEFREPWLLGYHADPQSARMLALVGDLSILNQTTRHGFYASWYGRPDMEMAVLSSYRVPASILDAIINPKHRIFYQAFHHYADELYASSPSFLISAGGHYATYAYTVGGGIFHNSDDIGLAVPTTVMPAGFLTSRDDLIRFDGSSDDTARSNMCVAPNFACGTNPALPESFLAGLRPECVERGEPWSFVKFTADCRLDNDTSPVGFYVVFYQRMEVSLNGERITAGFAEVFDSQVNPGISFQEFKQHVLDDNGNRQYHLFARSNTYVTITGQEVRFELVPDSRILEIVNGPVPPQSTSETATGTLVQSVGMTGLLTVANPYTGAALTLDDSDPLTPAETLGGTPVYAADACLPGFVWRLADASDHMCVTAARSAQTQQENKVATAHIVPGTLDTCKDNYTWRLADNSDHVCVVPESYQQAQWDNKLAPSRVADPLR
jgi:hypothetical protein